MKEAIITITIGTVIGGTIGAILYKILCSDCTPYIITFQKGIESMIKILRELCKIDPYYYDSIYEYIKDVHQSTKKRRKEQRV